MKEKIKKKLSFEYVFDDIYYSEILSLIWVFQDTDKKIKKLHLRYALCENNGITNSDNIKRCKEFFKGYEHILTSIHYKLSTNKALSRRLDKINSNGLKIIKRVPDVKGRSYYVLTDYGLAEYLQFILLDGLTERLENARFNNDRDKAEKMRKLYYNFIKITNQLL